MTPKTTLLRRIERLEEQLGYMELPKIVILCGLAKQDYENLAPGERIVRDRIQDEDGFVIEEDRITNDPNDHGRRCEEIITWTRHIRWIDPRGNAKGQSDEKD